MVGSTRYCIVYIPGKHINPNLLTLILIKIQLFSNDFTPWCIRQRIFLNQNNICVSIVFENKTTTKIWRKICFMVLISKLKNALFGGQPMFFLIFFSVSAFKIIDTQLLFWSVFLKTHKKIVINRQIWSKWCFWWSITFFVRFQKYQPKDQLCVYCL